MTLPSFSVTISGGGETWVAGTEHQITWDLNYLDTTGTIYLFIGLTERGIQ
jgi:hypothetical protein